jgi:hypothetical protein
VAKTKTSTKTKSKSKTSARGAGKTASRKAKASTTKSSKSSGRKSTPTNNKTKPTSDKEVTLDRRRGPRRDEEKDTAKPTAPVKLERRAKVNRRRQIDPTTCERDYTDNEVEFMNALDDYKRRSGRMFPTCSEVLEVVRGLGYVKMLAVELESHRGTSASAVSAKPMPIDWPALTSTNQAGSDDCLAVDCEAQMAY